MATAATTMHVEVVSAERAVLSCDATELYARGIEGQIGILPGHQPALIALDVGPVKIVRADGQVELVAVHRGLLFVDADKRVIVLADIAEPASGIDVRRARAKVAKLEQQLEATPHDEVLLAALKRNRIRLEVAETAVGPLIRCPRRSVALATWSVASRTHPSARSSACAEGVRSFGTVRLSGAKNSVLKLMAASLLADGEVVLSAVPDITDVPVMAAVLAGLGVDGHARCRTPAPVAWRSSARPPSGRRGTRSRASVPPSPASGRSSPGVVPRSSRCPVATASVPAPSTSTSTVSPRWER
jgi:F-type H+-transporting ATPase subunit epsilon